LPAGAFLQDSLPHVHVVASHDLKTPLNNIVHFSQLLGHRYKGQIDGEADLFIGYIVDGGKHMSRLISDILAYSRVSHHLEHLAPTPAGDAVVQALKNLEFNMKNTGAEAVIGEMPLVMADESHLVSLFQNLISNSLKYRAPDRKPKISINAERISQDFWRFSLADNGIGIDTKYHDKIFEIFQRLNPTSDGEGTGIGLTLCRRIVHRFGGNIWLESEPGIGTTFFFTLRTGSVKKII
jgi:light-regulated signal transduction histidine kinase (bacteriophytochrome)